MENTNLSIEEQERRKAFLADIKIDLEKYRVNDEALQVLWDRQDKYADQINRKVYRMLEGDAFVDRVDAFIGKNVVYKDESDRSYFMKVDRIQWGMWELTFYGKGLVVYKAKTTWSNDSFTIDYSANLGKTLESIIITDGKELAEIKTVVQNSLQSAIEEQTAILTNKYNSVLTDIDKYLEKYRETPNTENIAEDVVVSRPIGKYMRKATQFTWSQISKWAGVEPDQSETQDESNDLFED